MQICSQTDAHESHALPAPPVLRHRAFSLFAQSTALLNVDLTLAPAILHGLEDKSQLTVSWSSDPTMAEPVFPEAHPTHTCF